MSGYSIRGGPAVAALPCLLAMTLAMVACSDRPTVTGPVPTSSNQQVVKFWDDNAAVYWDGVAHPRREVRESV